MKSEGGGQKKCFLFLLTAHSPQHISAPANIRWREEQEEVLKRREKEGEGQESRR